MEIYFYVTPIARICAGDDENQGIFLVITIYYIWLLNHHTVNNYSAC